MLYKDGELYKMTDKDIKKVDEFVGGKYPVTLAYPKNRVVPSKLAHNKKPDKPASMAFPLSATVDTEKGSYRLVYADNVIHRDNGKKEYTPALFNFTGTKQITSKEKEFLFWLITACPSMEGGENYRGKKAKCYIENKAKDASEHATKRRYETKLSTLLYDEELGLPESKLRDLAKAYYISNIDLLTTDEVRLKLETAVKRDKRDGAQKFVEMCDAGVVIKVRSKLQTAIDKGIITHMPQKKCWAWVTPGNKKNEPIFDIRTGVNWNDALYDHYMADVKFAKELDAAIEGNTGFASE